MIYLSIFVAVVVIDFPPFGASKDLIRDSQRLQFYNSLRLWEKAQDNVSKGAAVKKKPSSLGKDKEDRNII